MYSEGSNEVKLWMENIARIDARKIKEAQEIEDENEDEITSSPFDTLERVREICNRNLKNPENDEEIEKLLKEIADEVKAYSSVNDDEEEDEKVSGEQRPSEPDPNAQAPIDMTGSMGQDMGAPGSDTVTAAGIGNNMAPAGGGQM